MLMMNEKIKAREVELTGLNGEELGVVSRDEALALAKRHKADLVCTSLFSSPPPCKLVSRGQAKQEAVKAKQQVSGGPIKVKNSACPYISKSMITTPSSRRCISCWQRAKPSSRSYASRARKAKRPVSCLNDLFKIWLG